jgi:hypothetical protein
LVQLPTAPLQPRNQLRRHLQLAATSRHFPRWLPTRHPPTRRFVFLDMRPQKSLDQSRVCDVRGGSVISISINFHSSQNLIKTILIQNYR